MKSLLILLLLLPVVQAVVISEIMANPAGNEPDFEYIELYGQGDIGNWSVEGIEGFLPENTTIQGFLILSHTPYKEDEDNDFFDRYGINSTVPFKGTLSNVGETLILRDDLGQIQDIVVYGDWGKENYSLERKDLSGIGVGKAAWLESVAGGTPGWGNMAQDACDWNFSLVMDKKAGSELSWQWRAEKIAGNKAELTIAHGVFDTKGNLVKSYTEIEEKSSTRFTSSIFSPLLTPGAYFLIANLSADCDGNQLKKGMKELIYLNGPEKNTESSLKITSSQKSIQNSMTVSIEAKRGNAPQDSFKVWVERGNKKLSAETKVQLSAFADSSLTLPLILKSCEEGTGQIIAEGLGERDVHDIEIICEKKGVETKGTITFNVESVPESVIVGIPFSISVSFSNTGSPSQLKVSSYLYRGSKRYSEEKNLTLMVESNKTINLPFVIENAKEGDYKIKIKVWKSGRKTPDELTEDLFVELPEDPPAQEPITNNLSNISKINQTHAQRPIPITGTAVYDADKSVLPLGWMVFGVITLAGVAAILLKGKMI